MKKLFSVILSIALVATLFSGTSVQFSSAAETTETTETDTTVTEMAETTEDGYRYESLFDFSEDIPETTTAYITKAYTAERVQDSENENKWAMKITQKSHTYSGDYIRFKFADPITIPTGEGLPFNEELVGMRISYRTTVDLHKNSKIGFVFSYDWNYKITDGSDGSKIAGSYNDQALFADFTKQVELGSEYQLEFELHNNNAAGGTPLEIYIYDVQFVYEVTPSPYRHSKVYDFENMTTEQAEQLFQQEGSKAAPVFSIIEDNGQKALQVVADSAVADGSYNGVRFETKHSKATSGQGFDLPTDDKLVGMRIHYKGINLRKAGIQLYDGSKSIDIDTATSSTDIGEKDLIYLFADSANWASFNEYNARFWFRMQGGTANNSDTLPGIIIYEIEFLYSDTYEGTAVTIEDFENISDTDAQNYMKQGGDNDSSTGAVYTYSVAENLGYNGSKGLKLALTSKTGYFEHKGSPLNLDDKSIIGVRICFRLPQKISSMEFRFHQTNVGNLYKITEGTVQRGMYDKVIMLDDIEGLDRSNNYPTYLKLYMGDGNVDIIYDEIQYIYANPTTAEFIDAAGISGNKSIKTTEGRNGTAIEFPEDLTAATEYEYFFLDWAKDSSKNEIVSSDTTHTLEDVKYYAVWNPGVSLLRKVLLGLTTTSAWIESNVNALDDVDICDLVYQGEYVDELKFQAELEEKYGDKPGKEFLESFGEQEAADMNGFDATVDNKVDTSTELEVGEYIQLDFEELTSVNTFAISETTDVSAYTIKAWNGEEWVRVCKNELIDGEFDHVLEQEVLTTSLRLYIDELVDGDNSTTIASVTAKYQEQIETTKKFGLSAFIGDSVYKHHWETIDSDMLMAYDDIILINNWHFDEAGNLGISVSEDEGTTRDLYKWDSDEGKTWTNTFLEGYNDLFDEDVNEEDKPNLWISLTMAREGQYTGNTFDGFDPSDKSWLDGLNSNYQPGESDAYGTESIRTTLINNIVDYIDYIESDLGCEIYGVDIDWEYPQGDDQQADYLTLLQELNTALDSTFGTNAKKISIDQLVNWCHLPYTDYNDDAIDRVNIMDYSPYLATSAEAIQGYKDAGVDLSKIYLGVPFYGEEMVEENARSTGWNSIPVGEFDRGVNNYTIGDVEYNFNGPNVLQDKVLYSLQKDLGGIMVWWIKNDYTVREATEAGIEYNKDLTLTYYLRDAVDRFSKVN